MRIEDKDPARHAGIEYPMEVGAPVFAPIKVVLSSVLIPYTVKLIIFTMIKEMPPIF